MNSQGRWYVWLRSVVLGIGFWTALMADEVEAGDLTYSDIIDKSDLASLNAINARWHLWDFGGKCYVSPGDTSFAYQPVTTGQWIGFARPIGTGGKLSFMIVGASDRVTVEGAVPDEIGNLSELRTLYLRFNRLTGGIPASFGKLTHLTTFDISSNQLSGPIPVSLGDLAELKEINLGHLWKPLFPRRGFQNHEPCAM